MKSYSYRKIKEEKDAWRAKRIYSSILEEGIIKTIPSKNQAKKREKANEILSCEEIKMLEREVKALFKWAEKESYKRKVSLEELEEKLREIEKKF